MIAASPVQDRILPDDGLGIVWEESPCPLCGSERWQTMLEAPIPHRADPDLTFAVVECRDCGLWFTNPRPDPESIRQFARSEALARPRLGRDRTSLYQKLRSRFLGRPCFERHRLPWHGQGRLLDVGCGNGAFLLRMQDQGWKVFGLHESADAIALLRREHGIKGLAGSLPRPELPDESFDVVTSWTGLEQARQPLAMLAEFWRLLAPGGRLYLQAPNLGAWGLSLFGANWSALDLPRRLTHFSSQTLRRMLEETGFRVRRIGGVSQPSLIHRSLRNARRRGTAGLLPRLLWPRPIQLTWSWLAYLAGGGDQLFASAEKIVFPV